MTLDDWKSSLDKHLESVGASFRAVDIDDQSMAEAFTSGTSPIVFVKQGAFTMKPPAVAYANGSGSAKACKPDQSKLVRRNIAYAALLGIVAIIGLVSIYSDVLGNNDQAHGLPQSPPASQGPGMDERFSQISVGMSITDARRIMGEQPVLDSSTVQDGLGTVKVVRWDNATGEKRYVISCINDKVDAKNVTILSR